MAKVKRVATGGNEYMNQATAKFQGATARDNGQNNQPMRQGATIKRWPRSRVQPLETSTDHPGVKVQAVAAGDNELMQPRSEPRWCTKKKTRPRQPKRPRRRGSRGQKKQVQQSSNSRRTSIRCQRRCGWNQRVRQPASPAAEVGAAVAWCDAPPRQ